MSWELSFISEKDFTNHVKDTIDKYGEKLESFDIVRFNKNIVDPIKMIFDKTVLKMNWCWELSWKRKIYQNYKNL